MLREVPHIVQDAPGLRRRWFRDEYFDLYVWERADAAIDAFQLCYDRADRERILTWNARRGFLHEGVDRPETKPGRAMTSILVMDGEMPVTAISRKLLGASRELPAALRDFVFGRLEEYGAGRRGLLRARSRPRR